MIELQAYHNLFNIWWCQYFYFSYFSEWEMERRLILVCISIITNYTEHLFICLLTTDIFFKYQFFCPFFIDLLYICYEFIGVLICKYYRYMIWEIFSQSMAYHLFSLKSILWVGFLILMRSNLFILLY